MLLSVREAAVLLERTPQAVRDLIAAGDLPARRVGRAFVLEETDVRALAQRPRPVGRPFSPQRAWQVIAVLSTGDPEAANDPRPDRVLHLIATHSTADLAARLSRRARIIPVAPTSAQWRRLLEDPRVVASAARPTLADDAYVSASDLQGVLERYRLAARTDPEAPRLRAVPTGVPPVVAPRRPRPPLAARLLDDVDSHQEQRRRRGLEDLTGLHRSALEGRERVPPD